MSEVWREGFPKKNGVYKCRIDGGDPVALVHKVCHINGKHRWMTLKGYDVVGVTVRWREGEATLDEL